MEKVARARTRGGTNKERAKDWKSCGMPKEIQGMDNQKEEARQGEKVEEGAEQRWPDAAGQQS